MNSTNDESNMLSLLTSEEGKQELYLYSLKKMAEQNAELERYSLTNLYGLNAFFFKANELLLHNTSQQYALIRMDLYRFKTVNEFCGRKVGDEFLAHIADCFREYEAATSLVGHLRADIFVLLLPYIHNDHIIEVVTNLYNKIIEYPLSCKVLPSFGICISKEGLTISLMNDYANLALQKIKGRVFTYYSFFDDSLHQQLMHEKKIENEILEAIKSRYLEVYIQPKVNMKTEEIIGGEALLRWNHPEHGILSPIHYIPVLEESGYIIEVDIYVWREVFQTLHNWINAGHKVVPISLNVSRLHEHQEDFEEVLCKLSQEYQVAPSLIKLEITESALSQSSNKLFDSMKNLKEYGFQFSMDDFGSGYSSLNMLKDEPLDEVKIDRLFLKDIEKNKSKTVIKHILAMLTELSIDTIAEGVETKEQADFLMECGCNIGQGYYYYKPMPIHEFEKLL